MSEVPILRPVVTRPLNFTVSDAPIPEGDAPRPVEAAADGIPM
jgi:hypothetical protein